MMPDAVQQLWQRAGRDMIRDMSAAFANPDGTLKPLGPAGTPVDARTTYPPIPEAAKALTAAMAKGIPYRGADAYEDPRIAGWRSTAPVKMGAVVNPANDEEKLSLPISAVERSPKVSTLPPPAPDTFAQRFAPAEPRLSETFRSANLPNMEHYYEPSPHEQRQISEAAMRDAARQYDANQPPPPRLFGEGASIEDQDVKPYNPVGDERAYRNVQTAASFINPLESPSAAAATALMFIPGIGWVTRGALWGASMALDPDEAEAAGGRPRGRLGGGAGRYGGPRGYVPERNWRMAEVVDPEGYNPASALFDYSKIHEVPDVPQADLERYIPPRGVSERVEDLTKNKRVQNKMLDYIQQGKDINAETFYYNEPLRQAFIDELGKTEGPKSFARYMDYVAATSPRSDVETNARNASYYYMLEKQGLPVPPQGGKNPEPYGHMAQNLHRLNAEKIRSGEYFDIVDNPKPLSFSQNLQGNFAPVTVDAHAFKLPAMIAKDPNFIATSVKLEKGEPSVYPSRMLESGEMTMADALKRPVYWASKPNPNEYGAMEQYYKRLAAETGMSPAQVQAAAWAGGGKLTGLESVAGDPFMRSVENRAIKTAAERGISPAEALSQMMRGKAPLLGFGGATVVGPGMMSGVFEDPEREQYH